MHMASKRGHSSRQQGCGVVLTLCAPGCARAQSIDADFSLVNNDGHGFFEAHGDSAITGPTLTHVNDFRVMLIIATH
jgi:glycerate 2-kinase